jgi:hypothetical protein
MSNKDKGQELKEIRDRIKRNEERLSDPKTIESVKVSIRETLTQDYRRERELLNEAGNTPNIQFFLAVSL